MNRASAWAGLLFLITLSACQGADTGGPTAGRSVTVDLRALQAPQAGSVQTDCVSAIAEAVLRVGPTASERRIPVPAGASSITFDDINVEQGMVAFSLSITSDNGTELYGKDTTARIDAAMFNIALLAEKRGPVLQVCPGHITLDRAGNFQDTLEVINRGIETLRYEAESPECPGGPCMSPVPPSGSVGEGVTARVVDSLIRMAPVASVEMRMRSPVGSVPITVTLPQLPDLVVAAFDGIGDPVWTGQQFELQVSVTIRNDGNAPAGIFLVAAMYDSAEGDVAAEFTPRSTTAPIAPGESETIKGTVSWNEGFQGQTLRLHMWADTCSKDGPSPCEIDEFSESNNFSQNIPVQFPLL